jgi:hypothetical protein
MADATLPRLSRPSIHDFTARIRLRRAHLTQQVKIIVGACVLLCAVAGVRALYLALRAEPAQPVASARAVTEARNGIAAVTDFAVVSTNRASEALHATVKVEPAPKTRALPGRASKRR